MKKVSILTFHWTYNYGGILQAYALQKTIENKGYEVSFINYHNEKEILSNHSLVRALMHRTWSLIAFFLGRKKRLSRTDLFRKTFMNISGPAIHLEDDLSLYYDMSDYYVVGSDQVWNPELTGNANVYLLSFAKNKKRIAYAASFGKPVLSKKYEEAFKKELPSFSTISVRETSSANIIKRLIGYTPQLVLDPIFLLPRIEWDKVAVPIKYCDYILCYYMPSPDSEVIKAINDYSKRISKITGLRIINIGKKEYETIKFWETNISNAGPREFVGLLKNAKFVITNSFHGTAFSLKYNIPFLTPINPSVSNESRLSVRIESLLELFNCQDRMINTSFVLSDSELRNKLVYDFSSVNRLMNENITQSIEFLDQALS